MFKHEEIAFMSGALGLVSVLFLVFEDFKTKNTDNLTYFWIFLASTAQALLLTYGKINNSRGLYIPAALYILALAYILYVKVIYKEPNEANETKKPISK